ncbi:unnamed protein product, partial [Coregonus sp. 'balchen']
MDPQGGGGRGGSYSTTPPVTAPLQPVLCSVPGDLAEEWHYLSRPEAPASDHWTPSGVTGRAIVPLTSLTILKISLDLITRSSSFLCLLGHRYGPSRPEQDPPPLPAAGPEREALSGVERNLHVAAEGGYPWVLTGRNQKCSLTELQITQAALMGDTRHCFFYFRDYSEVEEDEDRYTNEGQRSLLSVFSKQTEEERHRARELKNRIVDSLQPVRFFRTLQDLGDLVKRDWRVLMEQLYGTLDQQPTCSGLLDSLDRCYHEGAVQALCRSFAPSTQTTAVMEALNTFTASLTHSDTSHSLATSRNSTIKLTGDHDKRDSEGSIFLLCGESGCGKSSLATWWLQEFRKKNPRIPAIPHFCGISSSSVDIRSVLRHITTELRLAHYGPQAEWSEGLQHHVKPRSFHVVVQAFSAAAALGPCVLVLDGLDRLTGSLGLSMQEVKDLRWLPDLLPPQCKLLITATSTDLTYQRLTLRKDVHTLPLPGLSDPWVRRSVLLQHLTLPCLEPHRTLLQFILGTTTKLGMGRLPLFLAVVASELQTCCVLRGKEEEEELIEEYVEVDSMAELWARVIQRWINDYGGVNECTASPAKGTGGPTSQVSKIDLRGWVWDTLCLVHLSHAGLTEEQVLVLLEVLGYPGSIRVLPLEWARFRTAAGPWVQERPNGTLSLTHQSLGQAMDLLLLSEWQTGAEVTSIEIESIEWTFYNGLHLLVLPTWWCFLLGVRPGKGPGGLRKTRRGYHLSLAQTVEHLSTSWSQSSQLRIDVVRYWTLLILRGYDPYTSYRSLLGKGCHPPTLNQSGRWAFPPATHTEQREVHSNRAFMTESQSDGNGNGCQWDPGVKGKQLLPAEMIALLPNFLSFQAGEKDRDRESVMLLLTVRQTLAELYVEMDQHREAETHCRSALESAQTLTTTCLERYEGITVRKGKLLCVLCQLLFADGRTIEASQILSDIINMGHHKLHLCAEATVSLLCGIHRLISLQDPHGAEKHLQVALKIRRRWYGREHPLVVEVEECLADVWADTCAHTAGLRQRLAVELYRHTVHVKDQDMKLCSPTSPRLQAKGCSLAVTLVKLGRQIFHGSSKTESREAVELLQRALDLYICFLGSDHTLTRDLQQILNTESRRPLTPRVPRSGPLSHLSTRRLSSGTRPNTAAPLHSHLAWDRGVTYTPLDPSVNRSLSAPSNKTLHTQPEPDPEQEPVKNQNHRQNHLSSPRPWSAFQTTVFGPKSDIRNLISELKPRPASAPGFRSIDRTRVLHRAGWCHLPGRYLLEERTVTALNREIGSPLHTQRCTPLVRQTVQGQAKGGEQSSRDRVSYSARRR